MSDAIAKDRSPRSPAATLEDSLQNIRKMYDKIRTASVNAEIAVKAIGYGSANGAALTSLATLAQYGLVDRTGGKVTVTPLAIRILHPRSEEQKTEAIKEAAIFPKVMRELFEGMLDCSEDVITGHLVQSGYNPERAKRIASIHVANKEFARLETGDNTHSETPQADEKEPQDEKDLTVEGNIVRLQEPLKRREEIPSTETAQQQQRLVLAQYNIPLGSNEATLVFKGTKLTLDDFDALIDFVQFSKRQYERSIKATEAVKAETDQAPE